MGDISNRTLTIIVSAALAVSLVGLFSLPDNFFTFTGLVVTQGQARLNITETISLNLTNEYIDFGNGTIEEDKVNCTLTSEEFGTKADADSRNCWTGTGAEGGFDAVNIGNTYLNVTISATHNGTNSNDFWGALNGRYKWKCVGNGTTEIANYVDVLAFNASRCVHTLSPILGIDAFSVHINITIPPLTAGVKNDTITFVASKTTVPI